MLCADSAAEQACWVNELERYMEEKHEYDQRKLTYDISQQEG